MAIEFIFELLFELILEIFSQLVFALGWESVSASFQKRPGANPALAGFGYLLLGIGLGAISGVVFPKRFSQDDRLSGLGVLLNPAIFGLVALFYGERRRKAGRTTTNLATFWGGALFAFGFSAARLAVLLRMTT